MRKSIKLLVVLGLFITLNISNNINASCQKLVYVWMPVPGTFEYRLNLTLAVKGYDLFNFTVGDYDRYCYDAETYILKSIDPIKDVGVKAEHEGIFLKPDKYTGIRYTATAIESGRGSFRAKKAVDFPNENAFDGFYISPF